MIESPYMSTPLNKIEDNEHLFDESRITRGSRFGNPLKMNNPFKNQKLKSKLESRLIKHEDIFENEISNVYNAKDSNTEELFLIYDFQKKKIKENNAEIVIQNMKESLPSLQHENIVKFLELKETESSFLFIFEKSYKSTLKSFLEKNYPKGLTEIDAAKVFLQVLQTISFVHDNGYIHRDAKSESFIINDDLKIKLLNFSWCVKLEERKRTSFCGSFEYMSPEIINEIPYDNCVDCWTLGILLYELLHGYTPFKTDEISESSYLEIFKNISLHEILFKEGLSDSVKDLINGILFVIKGLLNEKIDERYTIKKVFNHPWLLKEQKVRETTITNNYLSNSTQNSNLNAFIEDKLALDNIKANQLAEGSSKIETNNLVHSIINKLTTKNRSKIVLHRS